MHTSPIRGRLAAVAIVAAVAALAAVPASPAQAQSACPSVAFSATTWSTGPDTGGFALTITLTNDCRITVDGWTLELTFAPDHALQHGWSARWTTSGSEVTATSLDWNSVLHTGDSARIGFIGSFSGTYQDPLTCTINGDACDGSDANQPPQVALTSPPDGGVFPSPCPVVFAADAVDPDGQVQLVEFYLNDTLVGSDDTAPYELTIPGGHPALTDFSGPNIAYAQAYDDATPPRSGSSPEVEFAQAVPPPALMIIACGRPASALSPGESHVVHFVGVCGGPVEVEVGVTGDPGITAEPASFTLGPDGQDVTITAAPDAAGATATVWADTTDGSCLPASVTVTVSG